MQRNNKHTFHQYFSPNQISASHLMMVGMSKEHTKFSKPSLLVDNLHGHNLSLSTNLLFSFDKKKIKNLK